MKFTSKGGVTVSSLLNKGVLTVQVKDTGIGIPEDSIEKVFTEFEQVKSASKGSVSSTGTGIGLSITKKAVL